VEYTEPSEVGSAAAVRPLVSAVIPTHNRADCLSRALDSVYGQEGRGNLFDLEVIVVDDASSDATPSVARAYPDIHYIRLPERRGVSAATNTALRASRGSYITFLDDDDVWLPHKLRVQVPLLNAHPEIGVVYSQSLVRSEGTEYLYPDMSQVPSGWIFPQMLMDNFCGHHASHLIRRDAFEKAGYFDETLTSNVDYDMSLRLAFHVQFLFMPGAVDVYNLSREGLWLTRAASGMGRADAARVIEKALHLLPDSPQYEDMKRVARAQVRLSAVYPLLFAGNHALARETIVTTLRAHPWIIRHDWGRTTLADVASKLACSTTSPVLTARELSSEIRSAILNPTVEDRWSVRRAIGAIWAGTALGLASRDATYDRDSAHAAAAAVATMPSFLSRVGLLRLIVRGVLGRRVDAFCARLYIRMRNMKGAAERSGWVSDLRPHIR
jgi:GT2 family glycosyltransferase